VDNSFQHEATRLWDSLFHGSLNQELINASGGGKNDGGISTITKKKMMVERNLKFSKTYVSRKVPCSFSLVVLYIIIASCKKGNDNINLFIYLYF
jgi:hypothetical protein